jgi:hypothetical protein
MAGEQMAQSEKEKRAELIKQRMKENLIKAAE